MTLARLAETRVKRVTQSRVWYGEGKEQKMVQLETTEDFENIRKIFNDPHSKPHEFRVKDFGYCTACKGITEYEGNYSMEYCSEVCLRCKRTFGRTVLGFRFLFSHSDDHGYITYSNKEHVPSEFRDELDRLSSREFQFKAFKAKLDAHKKTLKRKVSKLNSEIRRLAKLAS